MTARYLVLSGALAAALAGASATASFAQADWREGSSSGEHGQTMGGMDDGQMMEGMDHGQMGGMDRGQNASETGRASTAT